MNWLRSKNNSARGMKGAILEFIHECLAFRVILLLTGVLLGGCTQYAKVPLLVRDAKTGNPIEGATVDSGYLAVMDFFPAQGQTATTDAQGCATLKVPFRGRPVIDTKAPGFIMSRIFVHGDYFQDPKTKANPPTLTINLNPSVSPP
ncbi:MAG TPA: carboxypeptidase-like regulatory domain-containing protein [Phycisphaerae bacterium]|jgi:hypothetical protein